MVVNRYIKHGKNVNVKINELKEKHDFRTAILKGYEQMFAPCFFAALTTAVAFLSLTFGEIKPVIEFGKMMAFGISIAFILTFTFLPCLIYLLTTNQSKD